jgi:hypothetical protein
MKIEMAEHFFVILYNINLHENSWSFFELLKAQPVDGKKDI